VICMNFKDVEPIQVREIKYEGKSLKVKGTTIRWLTHRGLGGEEYRYTVINTPKSCICSVAGHCAPPSPKMASEKKEKLARVILSITTLSSPTA